MTELSLDQPLLEILTNTERRARPIFISGCTPESSQFTSPQNVGPPSLSTSGMIVAWDVFQERVLCVLGVRGVTSRTIW